MDEPILSGWYTLHGEAAYCKVSRDSDIVSVHYADGSYTAANRETFRKWGAKPAPTPALTAANPDGKT